RADVRDQGLGRNRREGLSLPGQQQRRRTRQRDRRAYAVSWAGAGDARRVYRDDAAADHPGPDYHRGFDSPGVRAPGDRRGAAADEGQRRPVSDRRLRPPADAPARVAEPLDRAARETPGLPDTAYRQEDRCAIRSADYLFDQHRAEAASRRGIPAAHPL